MGNLIKHTASNSQNKCNDYFLWGLEIPVQNGSSASILKNPGKTTAFNICLEIIFDQLGNMQPKKDN